MIACATYAFGCILHHSSTKATHIQRSWPLCHCSIPRERYLRRRPSAGGTRASGNYSYASFSAVMEAGREPVLSQEEEQAFGRRWSRWMHRNGVKHWIVPCTLLASVLVRWCIGLGSYSGTSSVHTYFYMMTSWSRCTQGRGRSPCSETIRPKGIGWNSRITCQRDSGTRTTYNIGVWTTPR